MKTTTHTDITAAQLEDFSPIEGTWDSSIPSSDDRDEATIESEIRESIEATTGYKVKVQLFREDGRAIGDYIPDRGSLLATRL